MESIKLILKYCGIYEWIIVRLTAVAMALYIIYLCVFVLHSHNLSYVDWYNMFDNKTAKIFNSIILLFILMHTWIGVRHILEDYIKINVLRQFIIGLICTILCIYLLSGLIIIWSL